MISTHKRTRLPELDLIPRAAALPVVASRVGPAVVAAPLLLLGVGLFGLGVWLLRPLNRISISVSPWLLSTGILLFRSSIRQFRWAGAWHFTRDYVERRSLGPFGLDVWREPMSAYAGVAAQQQPRRNHPLGRPYPVYTLVLEHASRPERNVLLYSCLSHTALRSRQMQYGRLFGKPLLTRGRSMVRERPSHEGMSVRAQVAEGVIDAQFDPATRPRGAMRTIVRNRAISFIAPRGRFRRGVAAVLLMAALACWGFAGIARLAPGLGSALTDWPWEAAAWTITPALALIWWFREELTVSPPRVARSLCFGSLILTTQSVPPSAVHDVYVGESVTAPNASCVCLETAIGDLTFGRTLSPAEQEWVRGCTLAVIAGPTAPPKARKAPPPRLPRGAPADHARAAGWAA